MTRERKAQILAVLALGAALGAAAYRNQKAPEATPGVEPKDAIYAAFDAGRQGKVGEYIEAHGGAMETALRKSLAESGESGFSAYLKQTYAPIQGLALQEPQPVSDREVKVRVEFVFADRNEAQWMSLEKGNGRWKICRVDSAERVPTLVPYGTPVP